MVFAGPDGETAQPLWAAEFPFLPRGSVFVPGGTLPAVCPAAFGRDFAAPLEPVGRRQRHSLRFGVELGALLSGQKPHPRGFRTPALFFRPVVGGGRTGQNLQFSPGSTKIEASVPGFPRHEGPAGGAGPPRFFGIGAIAGIFPHPHPAGFAPVPQGDGVYPGPPPRAAPSL